MDALQKLPSTNTSSTAAASRDMVVPDVFPAGLRVLVVDDDVTCLRILETMLQRCMYRVTTCSQASVALDLLREKKCHFDVVLSDVHMPDIDGFKLLELVGLEMDLPVIMMSADGRTSLVLRGIKHGACDYLIKPIREEELKNIWQHVVRKKWNGNKEHEHSGRFDDNDRHKRASDDTEYASSANEGMEGMLKMQKKRRDVKEEDDCELENDDPTASKKPRVVWSVELHQQFVSAVNQLGIDKAVPKRILEMMNVSGLTRENVASHLQKFRLYLKRLSGVAQQQGGIPNSYGRYDIQALAASGQIPPQTLAALHAELLGRPTNLVLSPMDQQALLQAQLLGSKCISTDHSVAYGQPMMKCPSNISKTIPQSIISSDRSHSGFGSWPVNTLGTSGASSNLGGLGAQSGSMLMSALQQQQKEQQQPKQSIFPEPSRSINVQPSCLVVPSQLSGSFHSGNSPASVNQTNGFNSGSVVDYNCIVPQSSNPSFGAGQMFDGNLKPTGVLSGYSGAEPISPSVSLRSVDVEKVAGQQVQSIPTFSVGRQLPGLVPNMTDMQGSYNGNTSQVLDQGMLRNLGFVGKGTTIPSRFAVYEPESPTSNLNQVKNYGDSGRKVKQEPGVDFHENSRVGIHITKHFSPNECFL